MLYMSFFYLKISLETNCFFWVFFYVFCSVKTLDPNSMLNNLLRWKNTLHFTEKSRTLAPFASFIFTKPSVSAAKLEDEPLVQNPRDTVSEILAGLKSLGFRRFVGRQYFKILVSTLSQPQVDLIIDSLRIENPTSALDFFYLLRNVYGFRHSRVSRFVVSHVLASKRWFNDLRFVIKQMVDEEGIDLSFFNDFDGFFGCRVYLFAFLLKMTFFFSD